MSVNTILQQAVVDDEFRAELSGNPSTFGISVDALPAAVEQPDQKSLDFWTEGMSAVEIYACATSCSWGLITALCDGTTK